MLRASSGDIANEMSEPIPGIGMQFNFWLRFFRSAGHIREPLMATKKELRVAADANMEEMKAMLQAVGQSISDWAHVEEGLFEIFYQLLAAPALGPPACAFIAAENVRSKIQMVDSMMRHDNAGRRVLAEWDNLLKRTDKLRAARNALVHRRVTTLKIGKAKAQPALIGYRHDIRHALEEEYGIPSHIKIDRVRQLSQEFRELGMDLLKFSTKIRHPPETT
jgi:hypothetical protein